jgi:AraC-like DNA-binding protein
VEETAEDFPADTALAAGVFAYVDFGVSRGLSREHLMAAARLDERMRADPDARVSIMAYVILWRELMTGLPGVAVPIELVRALDTGALGILGQVAVRADDVEQASLLVERFMRLPDTAFRVSRIERGELVGLSFGHLPQVEAMRFPLEVMVGVGFRALHHATGGALALREVTFKHEAGYPRAAYEELFGAPVRFGADETALWLPREALATPLASRDPMLRRFLETHAQQLLESLPPRVDPIVGQIREAVLAELATSGADLTRVARRVAMSKRTVQRRLEEAGVSYQDLVDEVRAALARRLLRDRTRSIIDVAFELGYADLKGFYRAFRRWTEMTPAEFRRSA